MPALRQRETPFQESAQGKRKGYQRRGSRKEEGYVWVLNFFGGRKTKGNVKDRIWLLLVHYNSGRPGQERTELLIF